MQDYSLGTMMRLLGAMVNVNLRSFVSADSKIATNKSAMFLLVEALALSHSHQQITRMFYRRASSSSIWGETW